MTTPRPIDYQIESRPQPQPQSRPANLQGVAAALGSVATQARTAVGQATSTLRRVGQTVASGARSAVRRAGEFAAWVERQQEELISRGRVTPATVAGTAASLVLPTTTMQIVGGQRRPDVRDPNTAIGLGADLLLAVPVAGAVARAARAGSTAARAGSTAAGSAARARTAEAAPAPAVARLVAMPTSLVSTFSLAYI
ncbi:MAG: hypothetical protein ACO2PN_07975 [Pyrobaculum sp.]